MVMNLPRQGEENYTRTLPCMVGETYLDKGKQKTTHCKPSYLPGAVTNLPRQDNTYINHVGTLFYSFNRT